MKQSGFRVWWQCVPGDARGGDKYRQRFTPAQTGHLIRSGVLLAVLALTPTAPAAAQAQLSGPLVVYNAGSLAAPFRDLLNAFVARNPGCRPAQENSGSVEAARKLTELGKIPDVIGVADYGVIPKLLIPKFAGWYVTFARNAMVVVYSDQSIGASEITPQNWWQVLLRPGSAPGAPTRRSIPTATAP